MTEAWEMRTNIRKPGGQGTLFQVGDKDSVLNPAQRWPKGYTPERQREIHEATKILPISYPDRMQHEHEPGEYHEMDSYAPKVKQILARSTVPAEDLKGLKEIHGEPQEGTEGTYWFSRKTIGVDVTAEHGGETLIHELGHHHDAMNDIARPLAGDVARVHAEKDLPEWRRGLPGDHSDRFNTSDVSMAYNKVQSGVAEAVADNYLTKHYRSPGKIADQKKAPRGAYEDTFTNHELDREYPGYTDVRPAKPEHLGPQFNTQEALPGMDRHWVQNEKDKAWFKKTQARADATSWATKGLT